jgi:hypothetical protein
MIGEGGIEGTVTGLLQSPAPLTVSCSMRHQPKSRNAKEVPRTPATRRRFLGRLFDDPIALFTAFVALFTCVLTIISGVQAWAFIASERAFVTVARPDLSLIAKAPDQPFQIPLVVVNTGRDTAIATGFNVTLMTSLPEKPQYIPISHASIKPLMVNTPEILIYRSRPGPWIWKFSKSEIDKIENGDPQLFIFGYIKYRDDYSLWGDKETGFCFRYIPKPLIPEAHYETCDNAAYTFAH